MPTLLQIDAGIADDASRTRLLTRACAEAWTARGGAWTVVHRDVHRDPPPYLRQRAQHWPEPLRGEEALAPETLAVQDHLIAELLAADAVVIGAPMYNYAMPSTLKAWIDLIHVPGVTASWGGSALPLAGRPMIIATAQGGPLEPGVEDLVTRPLAHLFGAGLGMDVHVVGVSRTLAEMIPDLGPDWAAADLARAREEAATLGRTVGVAGGTAFES